MPNGHWTTLEPCWQNIYQTHSFEWIDEYGQVSTVDVIKSWEDAQRKPFQFLVQRYALKNSTQPASLVPRSDHQYGLSTTTTFGWVESKAPFSLFSDVHCAVGAAEDSLPSVLFLEWQVRKLQMGIARRDWTLLVPSIIKRILLCGVR